MRATPALRRCVLKVLDQDVQRTFPLQQEEAVKATQCCLCRILLGDSHTARSTLAALQLARLTSLTLVFMGQPLQNDRGGGKVFH